MLSQAITWIYYAVCVYSIVFLGWNLIMAKDLQKAALCAVVILPFLLRVLRIK